MIPIIATNTAGQEDVRARRGMGAPYPRPPYLPVSSGHPGPPAAETQKLDKRIPIGLA